MYFNIVKIYFIALIFLIYMLFIKTNFLGSDCGDYIFLANSIINNHTISSYIDHTIPDNLRTIGYPIFIVFSKIISQNNFINITIFIQIIIYLASIFYFYKILNVLKFNKILSFTTTVSYAIHPEMLNIVTSLQTEALNTFFLLFFIYNVLMFYQTKALKYVIFSSLFLSIAIHIKPTYFYFIPFFLIFIYLFSRKFKYVFMASVIVIVIIGSWIVRNKLVLDTYSISSIQSYNLAYFRASDLLAKKYNVSLDKSQKLVDKFILENYDINASNLGLFKSKNKDLVYHIYPEVAKKIILDNIEYLPLSIANGLARQFLLPHNIYSIDKNISVPINEFILTLKSKDLNKIESIFNIHSLYLIIFPYIVHIVLILAFIIFIFYLRNNKIEVFYLFLLLYILYGSILVSGAESNVRFLMPYYPAMLIIASLILQKWIFKNDYKYNLHSIK